MKKQLAAYFVALLAFVAIASQARAISFVGSRAALGGNDFIDWSQLGPQNTVVGSPSALVSNGGLNASISTSNSTNMQRLDQSSGWNGNFAPGDPLIWNQAGQGDLIISFATGVFGVGAQVQADFFGAFTGTISAYDQFNNLLGTFNFNGVSDPNSDNSAVFAGVQDTTADIFKVVFHTSDIFGGNDCAINQLDLVTGRGVPDTGTTLSLLSLAIIGICLMRRFAKA
jgi:hypothetical protein